VAKAPRPGLVEVPNVPQPKKRPGRPFEPKLIGPRFPHGGFRSAQYGPKKPQMQGPKKPTFYGPKRQKGHRKNPLFHGPKRPVYFGPSKPRFHGPKKPQGYRKNPLFHGPKRPPRPFGPRKPPRYGPRPPKGFKRVRQPKPPKMRRRAGSFGNFGGGPSFLSFVAGGLRALGKAVGKPKRKTGDGRNHGAKPRSGRRTGGLW
jgi:hypothetical protein